MNSGGKPPRGPPGVPAGSRPTPGLLSSHHHGFLASWSRDARRPPSGGPAWRCEGCRRSLRLWHQDFKTELTCTTTVWRPSPSVSFCQREVLTSLSGCLWGLEVTQETWFLPCRSGTQKHYYKHWHYFISIIVDLTFLQHLFTSTFGILVFDTKKATWYSVLLSQGLVQSSQLPGICITFILSIMKTYFYFLCI